MSAKTLYDKLWEAHTVRVDENGGTLLYIDFQSQTILVAGTR